MSSQGERLGRYVLDRRTELDLSQLDVWQAGGPSNSTLTAIENGKLENLTRTTARKLDVGLLWEPGSAREVWNGGEPTSALGGSNEPEAGIDWLREQVARADIPSELRARLFALLDQQERRGSA